MGIARGTARFGASHAMAGVGVFRDVLAVGGSEEARPSGSSIKFCFRTKKQCATADAVICPVVVLVPVLAGESRFGTAGAGHLILLRSQLLLPLGFGLVDLPGELFCHFHISNHKMLNLRESCKPLPGIPIPSRSSDNRDCRSLPRKTKNIWPVREFFEECRS